MMRTLGTFTTALVLAALWACNGSTGAGDAGTKCGTGDDRVGMSTFGALTVEPGKSLEVSCSTLACNGQCPVTGQSWTVTPKGSASGTFTITYGAHCGSSAGAAVSSDTIGTCKLLFAGTTAVTDGALASSHDADCVALWAGVNPANPADTKPCSEGSTNNFMPYIVFFNNGTVAVTISGPGPASNPTANCTYAPT